MIETIDNFFRWLKSATFVSDLIIRFVMVILTPLMALSAATYVDGYTKSNGTYVEGYYRSSPNNTVYDNYSTDGNVNPYTGEEGDREVYDGYESGNSHYQDPSNSSEKPLIIAAIVLGVIVTIIVISMITKNLFVRYLLFERKTVFWSWVLLTLINQVIFFGSCLAPYCILASIPHVSLITIGIMYLMYKSALITFDPKTGYNYFGYDKDGYNQYGYDKFGYDKNGYNAQGLDRDGKDRLGKGFIGRLFAGSEYKEKILKINKEPHKYKTDYKSKADSTYDIEKRIREIQNALDDYKLR